MTLAHASPLSSTSAVTDTRNEDDEGRGRKNDFSKPQYALAELVDAAQFWDANGQPASNGDARRVQALLVELEVGILQEHQLSESARAETSIVTLEVSDESSARGPVAAGSNPVSMPILEFRKLVLRELLKPHGRFFEIYRAPNLRTIQEKARSVLASR